ncbi:hypothetical protein LAUMK35_03798 [Mycobacterium pseudokansasii]|uniref:Serine/threonine-protein kinase PknH n=2 Tax=Mycobacterium pseudokansasii TaxID=2341080 RepID=A0A498QUS0_9MYCO|nr:hypothetical protein LAUMK35_03798 [Mycobacterium pseudokansasii]VAZ99176.1 hypothetical protein LAUMK21_03795 [Mycobacterium pseudokansasii]VBA52715.1 hypothetical protein LAUMK142_03687 [Mycobacterium pseudokansasii]
MVRAILAIAVGVTSACGLAGCFGAGGKTARPTVPVHDREESRLPPIYPGTTVSIPPSTTPVGPANTIPGDGTYRVGVDIRPGTYRSQGSNACYWERLRGLGGTVDDIIANGAGTAPQVVQIAPTDVAFKTQRCPAWTLDSGATAPSTTSTTSTTPVTVPEGAHACPTTAGPAGGLSRSAVGSSATSCQFAEQVRLAYGASGPAGPAPRQVTAVSPVTGQSYTMTCSADGGLVVCRGGDDAVVYLY